MTPKIDQHGTLGPSGAIWGSHGAHQMPQDRFWPQFGIPNDPKMCQNDSNMGQNDPKIGQNRPKWHPSKIKGGSAALAKPSDPPPPGLVPGGNGVPNHLPVFKIFQDLRTCSLRPPPVPPTRLVLASFRRSFFHFVASFFGLIFDLVFVSNLGQFRSPKSTKMLPRCDPKPCLENGVSNVRCWVHC